MTGRSRKVLHFLADSPGMAPQPEVGPGEAIKTSLDPRVGKGAIDKVAPLVVSLATVAIAIGCAFGFVPGADVSTAIALLAGGGVGAYVMHQGH